MSADLINQPELYESTQKPESEKDRLRVAGKELAINVDYDRIEVTYPSTTQELYTYKLNGNTILNIEVNYATAAKKDLILVRVV